MRILDPVIDRALAAASELMNEADRGFYRVNGEEISPLVVETIGCMLAEFFDRLSPATKPHGWTCDHIGYRFWARNDGR